MPRALLILTAMILFSALPCGLGAGTGGITGSGFRSWGPFASSGNFRTPEASAVPGAPSGTGEFLRNAEADAEADPESLPDPELRSGPLPDPAGRSHPPRLALTGADEPEVAAVLAEYTNPSRMAWFAAVYARAAYFRTHIMDVLEDTGLPPEFFFIAFIESEFVVGAESSSGARGIWQFVENSMAPWMTKNDYKDERFSFYLATLAAAEKLADNYRVLGDWLLAAAAYNAGLGAVSRAVQRTGIRDYWELARAGEIPEETRRYIPKLIASASVAAQLGRLGWIAEWQPPVEWTQVMVPAGTTLEEAALVTGLSTQILQLGNYHLLTGAAPANERFYPLTVPAAYAPRLRLYFELDRAVR